MGFVWLSLGGDDWVCSAGNHSWHGREDENDHLEAEVRHLRRRLLHASPGEANRLTDQFHTARDQWRRKKYAAVKQYAEQLNGPLPPWIRDDIAHREQWMKQMEHRDIAEIHNKISREEYFEQCKQQQNHSAEQERKHREEEYAYMLARQAKLRLRNEEDQKLKERKEQRRREELDAFDRARTIRTRRVEEADNRQRYEQANHETEAQERREKREQHQLREQQRAKEEEAAKQAAADRQARLAREKEPEEQRQRDEQLREERARKDEAKIKSKFSNVRPDALVCTGPSSNSSSYDTVNNAQQQRDLEFQFERAAALRRIRAVHNSAPSESGSNSTAKSSSTTTPPSSTTLALRPAVSSSDDFARQSREALAHINAVHAAPRTLPAPEQKTLYSSQNFERERVEALARINAVHSAPRAIPAPSQSTVLAPKEELPWIRNARQSTGAERESESVSSQRQRPNQREKMPWEN